MSGFKVSPAAIRAYSGVISAQSDNHDVALDYVDNTMMITADADGLIVSAGEFHAERMDALRDAVTRAKQFFDDSANQLDETAKYYDNTDEEEAQRYDGDDYFMPGGVEPLGPDLVPSVQGLPAEQELFWDGEERAPVDFLTTPDQPEPFASGPLSIFQNLSPAYWIRQLIVEAAGKDPFQEAAQWLVGDWDAFARVAEACSNLERFYIGTRANTREWATLSYSWQGNAANIAFHFFEYASQTFYNEDDVPVPVTCIADGIVYEYGPYHGYAPSLRELSDEYKAFSEEVYDAMKAIVQVFDDIINWTFWGSISAATGGIFSWTGVVGVIGGGSALVCAGKIVDKVAEYSTQAARIQAAVDGLDMATSSGPINRIAGIKLPETYRHPGA